MAAMAKNAAAGVTGKEIWIDGEWIAWDDANVHVLTHTLHYGLGVFEGIRCYAGADGRSAVFRLPEHFKRLFDSAKINLMEIPFSPAEIEAVTLESLRRNDLAEGYIRPIAFIGDGVAITRVARFAFAFASDAFAAGRRAGASSASPFATGSVGEGGGRDEPSGRGRGTGDSGVGTFDARLALVLATSASDPLGAFGAGRSGLFEGAAPGSSFFGDRNTMMPPLGAPRRGFPPVGPPDMARHDV